MKLEDIAKEAEIDLSLLPIQTSQVWFPLDTEGLPMPSGWALTENGSSYQKPSLWQIGKPPPDEASFSILAMFSSDAEVRVYASGPANKAPRRYTLSKTAPLIGVERMAPDVFSSEIEEEWQALKGEEDPQDVVDDVVQEIVDKLKEEGVRDSVYLKAAALIEQEFQEPEDETPPNGSAQTEPAPAAS